MLIQSHKASGEVYFHWPTERTKEWRLSTITYMIFFKFTDNPFMIQKKQVDFSESSLIALLIKKNHGIHVHPTWFFNVRIKQFQRTSYLINNICCIVTNHLSSLMRICFFTHVQKDRYLVLNCTDQNVIWLDVCMKNAVPLEMLKSQKQLLTVWSDGLYMESNVFPIFL